jgi:hypothetical protein
MASEADFVPFQHSPWGKYADAMAYSGFSRAHVEKAAYSGQLKSNDAPGKGRRFHRDWLDDWMRRGAPAAKPNDGKAVAA